jgi:hypothetical protein
MRGRLRALIDGARCYYLSCDAADSAAEQRHCATTLPARRSPRVDCLRDLRVRSTREGQFLPRSGGHETYPDATHFDVNPSVVTIEEARVRAVTSPVRCQEPRLTGVWVGGEPMSAIAEWRSGGLGLTWRCSSP